MNKLEYWGHAERLWSQLKLTSAAMSWEIDKGYTDLGTTRAQLSLFFLYWAFTLA